MGKTAGALEQITVVISNHITGYAILHWWAIYK